MPGISEHLDNLTAALDGLAGLTPADLAQVADGDTIERLHRQQARLEASVARATAAFDRSRTWTLDGAKSCAAWVSVRCRIPLSQARRVVRLGRALREMPLVEQAWLGGALAAAHASLLARARQSDLEREAFERDEEMLVEQATSLRYDQWAQAVAYWRQLADEDGCEDEAERRERNRRAHISPGLDGMVFLDAVLTPIGGAIVTETLRRIEREMFDADRAEARQRLGRDPLSGELRRTAAQRRHDALVEMARRAASTPPGSRRPEPLFTVLVGYETFAGRVCELANRTVVTPGSLVPWLSEAWVERVVFDSPDRVLNVGVRRRLFQGATRRAVEVRDRECFHETCDVPASECQADHIEPYGAGGLTTDDNGRPACPFHNRLRHQRGDRQQEPPG